LDEFTFADASGDSASDDDVAATHGSLSGRCADVGTAVPSAPWAAAGNVAAARASSAAVQASDADDADGDDGDEARVVLWTAVGVSAPAAIEALCRAAADRAALEATLATALAAAAAAAGAAAAAASGAAAGAAGFGDNTVTVGAATAAAAASHSEGTDSKIRSEALLGLPGLSGLSNGLPPGPSSGLDPLLERLQLSPYKVRGSPLISFLEI
jgi:hypothetical protein